MKSQLLACRSPFFFSGLSLETYERLCCTNACTIKQLWDAGHVTLLVKVELGYSYSFDHILVRFWRQIQGIHYYEL